MFFPTVSIFLSLVHHLNPLFLISLSTSGFCCPRAFFFNEKKNMHSTCEMFLMCNRHIRRADAAAAVTASSRAFRPAGKKIMRIISNPANLRQYLSAKTDGARVALPNRPLRFFRASFFFSLSLYFLFLSLYRSISFCRSLSLFLYVLFGDE